MPENTLAHNSASRMDETPLIAPEEQRRRAVRRDSSGVADRASISSEEGAGSSRTSLGGSVGAREDDARGVYEGQALLHTRAADAAEDGPQDKGRFGVCVRVRACACVCVCVARGLSDRSSSVHSLRRLRRRLPIPVQQLHLRRGLLHRAM